MTDINEMTIRELRKLYRDRSVTVREVVQEYIDRIRKVDQGEDGLNSVLEINPDAIEIADKLDARSSEERSLLFGVPILLKDSIDTADRMHTSAGSLALAASIVKEDAPIVKALREKGAVILGKTNMTEFANYMTKGIPAGYSSRGGQVESPYRKGEDPSGSSTGSAVAVSANLCMAAIGTDTSGSIITPGNRNGIVGFRPSIGSVSQKGIIPISFTLDVAGPMTRTVEDSQIIFQVLTSRAYHIDSLEESISPGEVTIGLSRQSMNDLTEEEQKKTDSIVRELEKAGAKIKEVDIPTVPGDRIERIKKYEFKNAMNRYLSTLPADFPIRSLQDIIDYNIKHGDAALRYGQTYMEEAQNETRGDLSEAEYIDALKDREMYKAKLEETMSDISVCLLLKENLVLQFTGLPTLTLPRGLYNDGMPFGIYLTAGTDAGLLRYARVLEGIVGSRKAPRLFD